MIADNAFVHVGLGLGATVEVAAGALSNVDTLQFLSDAGYDSLTPGDGTMPCFGATVALDSGSTLVGGSTFEETSFYWKGGDDPSTAEAAFGSTPGGITEDGDELDLPKPTLTWFGIEVELSLPAILEMPNTGVDHFATPVDDDGGC